MRELFRQCIAAIREDLGTPVTLVQVLAEHPELRMSFKSPKKVVALSRVPQWHNWYAKRGEGRVLFRVARRGRRLEYQNVYLPALAEMVQHERIDRWSCDIQRVEGFSGSKSRLEEFATLDEMVQTNSQEMIDEISQDKLNENLAHREIRIIHQPDTSDRFEWHQWDGRVFLVNSGGSHHLAAARLIAGRIRREVSLNAKLDAYSINPTAVRTLGTEFDMYALTEEPVPIMAFREAMECFGATYGTYPLPRPFGGQIVFLPRNEDRSVRVSQELRATGFADIGDHLQELAARPSRPS